MKIDACGATHKGNIRKHNEDNIYVDGMFRSDLNRDDEVIRSSRTEGPYVYGVFDGLGGEARGERASLISAMMLREAESSAGLQDVKTYIADVQKAIVSDAYHKKIENMGTTAALLISDGDIFTAYNVGDSRVYLIRRGQMERLTRDHSVEQSMIDCGFMEESERYTSAHAGELTQYLGMTSEEDIEPEADSKSVKAEAGDIFILCSDGLSGELSDSEIAESVENYRSRGAEYIAVDLIRRAIEKEGKDNVSAIAVCIH